MRMVEEYTHKGEGYNPFLIREGWQIAKLNPLPGHSLDEIDKIEVHKATDEVFVLIRGKAILIAAEVVENKVIDFEVVKMLPGIVYNLPKGQWHNIAMDKDVEIIIVEKDNTHLNDCCYLDLNSEQQKELRELIKEK